MIIQSEYFPIPTTIISLTNCRVKLVICTNGTPTIKRANFHINPYYSVQPYYTDHYNVTILRFCDKVLIRKIDLIARSGWPFYRYSGYGIGLH